MSKSKSTPIRSKKLSLSVMNRTSIVTCKSCRRRSCSRQVGDLLVNFLRLADDEAEVACRSRDRARPADFVPALRRNGRGDQLDQCIEVGRRPAAHAARSGSPAAAESGADAIDEAAFGANLGQSDRVDRGAPAVSFWAITVRADRSRAAERLAVWRLSYARADGAGTGPCCSCRHKIRDRHHQVSDVVDLGHRVGARTVSLVISSTSLRIDVAQVQRLQDQVERERSEIGSRS